MKISTLLVLLLLVVGMLVPATSASASECDFLGWKSTALDYASISDSDNNCGYIQVRHYYDPPWSIWNYWEGWTGSWGTYARTAYNLELLTAEWAAS